MTATAPPVPRAGLTAAARLTVGIDAGRQPVGIDAGRQPVGIDAGRQRIRWSQSWPVLLRPTGDDRVHLVHGAGGPLGGDDLGLTVDVGAGAVLSLRSAGATVVQPGVAGAPARWDTVVAVGAGGHLHWAPEATVVTDRAVFESGLRIDLAPGATAVVREIVVLGRHGTRGGSHRGVLDVRTGGAPLFLHRTMLDGADAALCGPAGTAGARAVGTLLVAGSAGPERDGAGEGPGVRWAWSELDRPGRVLFAVGDPGPVTALLDRACAAGPWGPDRPGTGQAPGIRQP